MTQATHGFVEEVEIRGHIIDSLLLPKVLDEILTHGGSYVIKDIRIGQRQDDTSHARIEVRAPTAEALREVLDAIHDHGAVPVTDEDCATVEADMDGAFPEGFYSTTNYRTQVRLGGEWVEVEDQEMDCGILVDAEGTAARCVPMTDVRRGDRVVVGRQGLRVFPAETTARQNLFEFMASPVSSEKPKGVTVREIAAAMRRTREAGEKLLAVLGPAVVHTGSVELICRLIRTGYLNVLFAGNALATHDIEQALYGTSLGISLDRGLPTEEGHEHHLRAINTIRRLGGIRTAVERGVLKSGIMYECVKHDVPFVLAGSIRDDGPLPEVITDVLEAQRRMREYVHGVGFCLMVATMLHSIATGNLLPAWVRVACVDINPATVTKLTDRGSIQTVGVVTDAEPFLRSLVAELER
ncbi:MAG TPA: TIGR00300 family protein [Gemmataceae bacterium]|jgi:lysine-ketoglutarate reductase/saccharopine dehydrogenase-like protein (TIGR00300 family)|nr:TIGR00300 family protein [Gemmataceae bacterium]